MVVEGLDLLRLDHYANTLRPLFDPLETVNELFILPGPHALGRNFSYRLGALNKSYNLDVPNATRIRKAGVSTAALKLDVQQINLLAKQMAHSSDGKQVVSNEISTHRLCGGL